MRHPAHTDRNIARIYVLLSCFGIYGKQVLVVYPGFDIYFLMYYYININDDMDCGSSQYI